MDIGSIFLILALILLVSLYLTRPFMEKGNRTLVAAKAVEGADHEVSGLLAERDRILRAIQDLDFDHQLGKIPEEDYPLQRKELMLAGVAVLSRLDELKPALAASRASAQLAASSVQPESNVDDELEGLIAARRTSHSIKATGFCPKCGKPTHAGDQFCPRCGVTLKA
jgi:hypothetical protein